MVFHAVVVFDLVFNFYSFHPSRAVAAKWQRRDEQSDYTTAPMEQKTKLITLYFMWFFKVGGIFLIFLWILVDQLYIQMGVKKNDTGGPPGSSALKRKNSSAVMVIDHSTYANSYATLPRPGKILGVGELEALVDLRFWICWLSFLSFYFMFINQWKSSNTSTV